MSCKILERWPQGDGIEYSTIAVLYGFIITSRSTHMVYILYYHSTFCHIVTVSPNIIATSGWNRDRENNQKTELTNFQPSWHLVVKLNELKQCLVPGGWTSCPFNKSTWLNEIIAVRYRYIIFTVNFRSTVDCRLEETVVRHKPEKNK